MNKVIKGAIIVFVPLAGFFTGAFIRHKQFQPAAESEIFLGTGTHKSTEKSVIQPSIPDSLETSKSQKFDSYWYIQPGKGISEGKLINREISIQWLGTNQFFIQLANPNDETIFYEINTVSIQNYISESDTWINRIKSKIFPEKDRDTKNVSPKKYLYSGNCTNFKTGRKDNCIITTYVSLVDIINEGVYILPNEPLVNMEREQDKTLMITELQSGISYRILPISLFVK